MMDNRNKEIIKMIGGASNTAVSLLVDDKINVNEWEDIFNYIKKVVNMKEVEDFIIPMMLDTLCNTLMLLEEKKITKEQFHKFMELNN